MVESYSKEKLGRLVVDQALKEMDRWAFRELKNLSQSNKTLVCVPLSDRIWIVGKYKIIQDRKNYYALYYNSELINKFYHKKAAFVYAILEKIRNYSLSELILNNDQIYSRYKEKQDILLSKYRFYAKNKNFFKKSLIYAKLTDINLKVKLAQKELEKNLIQAKYVKVWD